MRRVLADLAMALVTISPSAHAAAMISFIVVSPHGVNTEYADVVPLTGLTLAPCPAKFRHYWLKLRIISIVVGEMSNIAWESLPRPRRVRYQLLPHILFFCLEVESVLTQCDGFDCAAEPFGRGL
jgi:hypothetical protein